MRATLRGARSTTDRTNAKSLLVESLSLRAELLCCCDICASSMQQEQQSKSQSWKLSKEAIQYFASVNGYATFDRVHNRVASQVENLKSIGAK